MQVTVTRKKLIFSPDPSRVIARFLYVNDERATEIIRKVLAMPEKEVNIAMSQLLRSQVHEETVTCKETSKLKH